MTDDAGTATAHATVQGGDVVELRLPADGAYLSVLRTATAGLAARLDFTLDEIEDLRIAVDEACALLLPDAEPGRPLTCRVRADRRTLAVDRDGARAGPAGCRGATPSPGPCSPRWPATSTPPWCRRHGIGDPAQARRAGMSAGSIATAGDDSTRSRPGDRPRAVRPVRRAARGRPDPAAGARPAGRDAPAAGRIPGPPVRRPRRAARRPRPGRHDRADQGGRPVRHRARRRVLDVRDADGRRRDQAALPRQGLGGPGAAPAAGAAAVAVLGHRGALPEPGPLPHGRRARRAPEIGEEEVLEGLESANAYTAVSLDASDRRRGGPRSRTRSAPRTLSLEGVEYRESLKPLLDSLPRPGAADPACCGSSAT